MKKLLTLLALLSLSLCYSIAFADVAPEPDVFTDIQDGGDAYWEIRWMKDQGFVSGYSDGSYQPDAYINRAEFSKIVELFADSVDEGSIGTDGNDLPFSDVETSDWFEWYVHILYQRGIIGGYSDGSFRPANNVNYAEACKMIMLGTGSGELTSTGEWYEPYVQMLEDFGGKPDSIESNDQYITRAEMAIMIYGVSHNY